MVKLFRLFLDCCNYFRVAVAKVHDPDPASEIDVIIAVCIGDNRTLGLDSVIRENAGVASGHRLLASGFYFLIAIHG